MQDWGISPNFTCRKQNLHRSPKNSYTLFMFAEGLRTFWKILYEASKLVLCESLIFRSSQQRTTHPVCFLKAHLSPLWSYSDPGMAKAPAGFDNAAFLNHQRHYSQATTASTKPGNSPKSGEGQEEAPGGMGETTYHEWYSKVRQHHSFSATQINTDSPSGRLEARVAAPRGGAGGAASPVGDPVRLVPERPVRILHAGRGASNGISQQAVPISVLTFSRREPL